ncbi:MAG: matrixin family metalloprotease [Bryobacteraceae bacterium]
MFFAVGAVWLSAPAARATTYAPDAVLPADYVLGPTTPGKWGPPVFGTGATVTWSLMSNGLSCAAEFAGCTITALSGFMPGGFLAEIQAAFTAWESVADLLFLQVADCGAALNAPCGGGDIRLGGHAFDGPSGTLAHAFFAPVNGLSAAGDVHFDIAETWKIGFGGPGFDIFQAAVHEIGHALGLNHTGVPNSLMNMSYTEAFSGPQADDVAGMQFIYGPSLAQDVPEPGSVALFSAGMALLAMFRRMRRY